MEIAKHLNRIAYNNSIITGDKLGTGQLVLGTTFEISVITR